MDHFYQDISGWWDDKDRHFYGEMVNEFPSGSHFVEVGSFKGRSSACMAVEIINSDKDIKFDCVDTWMGSAEHQQGGKDEDADVVNGTMFDVFLENTSKVSNIINPMRMSSTQAAPLYEANSLDFVFIDGAHDFENVLNDIRSWAPKVKAGGVIAGHDYGHQGVDMAVDSFFENIPEAEVQDLGSSWWFVRKNFEMPPVIHEIPMRLTNERFEKLIEIGIIPSLRLHDSYKNLIGTLHHIAWSFKT